MTPATYILLLVLGWLALALAILWAMLRLSRRTHPLTSAPARRPPKTTSTSPVATRKQLAC